MSALLKATTAQLVVIASGIFLRFFLIINSQSLCKWLQSRVEISTPLTSWRNVLEGIYLKNLQLSSYNGDLVHEIPIMLHFYQFIYEHVAFKNPVIVSYLFVLVDLVNGVLIGQISKKIIDYLSRLEERDLNRGKYSKLVESIDSKERLDRFLITSKSFSSTYWSLFALIVYLFNPYTLSSCLAISTVSIHNSLVILWLYFLLNNNVFVSFVFLALHSNITIYSSVLIAASISFLLQKRSYVNALTTSFKLLSLFLALVAGFFMLNLYLEDFSPRFIECTYLFILQVPNLVPNLGLFWYFFTEMFDHFIIFFTFVFQLNAFIYSIPLTLRLKDNPVTNIFLQVGFLSIFKSYPSIGETGLYISLLPTLAYLFPLMRNVLVYTCMLIASSVLAPIMYYLWLGSGGGNANFYFAITLVYSIGQIFLLVDVLYSSLKREFIKQHGVYVPKNKDGTLAVFTLE